MKAATQRVRAVAIVAAHFVPSNLAGVHRSRLWSLHLREFGWEPVIVTTHWDHYEEQIETALVELIPPDLKIIRTQAFGTRPTRLVGDLGVRAFRAHYRSLLELAHSHAVDFVHITIPSNFSAPLGRLVRRKTGVPYGIDYIDPWVHEFPGSRKLFTKAWASARLADWLEPWAVRDASLITGINRRYFQGVLDRNPHLVKQAVLAEMPYGGSEADHDYARRHLRPAELFAAHAGKFNLIYAGAMLPNAYVVLDRLLASLVLLKKQRPGLPQQFHLQFVGTGKSPDDAQGYNIKPHLDRHGLSDCATEHPQRLPYLDVLTHLHAASGVLVLGSTEPHYSPSKIFQSVMSRRPVFALLHKDSTAVGVLHAAQAGQLVTLTENALPDAAVLSAELERFIFDNKYSEDAVQWDALAKHSARESARILAQALDEAMTRRLSGRIAS
ncbi:MAG: hypothetical protein IH623_07125 [Verrucomicrobia bacterium]|nr:hypothetical protein [Verrucomicrobiota bacterium]